MIDERLLMTGMGGPDCHKEAFTEPIQKASSRRVGVHVSCGLVSEVPVSRPAWAGRALDPGDDSGVVRVEAGGDSGR